MQNYPSPRYPRFKKPGSAEELLPKARELVGTPPGQPFYAFKPSYNIRKGDKILFVVLSEYHPMVVEAMHTALKEKGAAVGDGFDHATLWDMHVRHEIGLTLFDYG